MIEERKKWKNFFEILKRPYVWITLLILTVIIDHFLNISHWGWSIIKNLAGVK